MSPLQSDLDIMVAMLERAGIEYKREEPSLTLALGLRGEQRGLDRADHTILTIERGYMGFASLLYFNPAGALTSIEAYE